MNIKNSLLVTKQQEQDRLSLEVKKDVLTLIQAEVQEVTTRRSIQDRLIDSLMENLDPLSEDPLGNQGKLKLLEILDKGSFERTNSIISGMKAGIVINNSNTANASNTPAPAHSERDISNQPTSEEMDVFKKFLGQIKATAEIEETKTSSIIDLSPVEFSEIKEKEIIEMPEVIPQPLVFRESDMRPPIRKVTPMPEPIHLDDEIEASEENYDGEEYDDSINPI